MQDICESFSKYYNFNDIEDNSEEVIINNLNKINKKIITIENKLNNYKTTIDNLYIDKVEGLVDKDMYKRIYDKFKIEIDKDKKVYVYFKFKELLK